MPDPASLSLWPYTSVEIKMFFQSENFGFIFMQWLVAVITLAITCVYIFYKYAHAKDHYWPKRGVPLILRDEIISWKDQLLLTFRSHEVDYMFYQKLKKKGLKFAGLMEFRKPVIYVRELDLIRNITVKDFDHFVNHRKETPIPSTSPNYCIQFGLPLMRNQAWKKLRSIMTPAYSTLKIKRMFELFISSGEGLLSFVSRQEQEVSSHPGQGVNVTELCRRSLITTTCSVAFGLESNSYDKEPSIFHEMSQVFEFQFHGLGFLKIYLNLLVGKRIMHLEHMRGRVISFFKDSIQQTIQYRKEKGVKREDFLDILLETREKLREDGKGQELTDDVIFAQCIFFFLAGYYNIVVLLVYTMYELAMHGDVQDRLREEVRERMNQDGGRLTYEGVNEMRLMNNVITETQRMYSTSGGGIRLERECTEDYPIPDSNVIIPKGTLVVIPNQSIHQDPDIYPEPEKWDPDRWTQEFRAGLHPCAYMPFGMGPRLCIAQRYTLVCVKTCIAQLVSKFKFERLESTPVPMAFTKKENAMRPAEDLYLRVTPV